MIIKFGILIALILGALLFVGVKMGEDINVTEVKMFFFILYGMSIFTVFNIVISVYFFTSLRNKRGPPGPKGKPGRLGDRGDHGDCNEDNEENCLKKSLETIIVDTLEKKLAEEYNEAMKAAESSVDVATKDDLEEAAFDKFKPLQAFEKILICSYVNKLYQENPDKFRNFFANDIHDEESAKTANAANAALDVKAGYLMDNKDAVPGPTGTPVQGTSVFKIQELKKKINTAVTINSKTQREKDHLTHFLSKRSDSDALLNNIISGQITGINNNLLDLDSENCT